MMSKTVYVEVASIIDKQRNLAATKAVEAGINSVARDLAEMFERDNPRFDRYRFLVACGFGKEGA